MNYMLRLSYDGTRYRGWQRLGDCEMTIQGKLERVLSKMVGADVEVIGSGRTDAGAHAACQVANFHCNTDMTPEEIKDYLRQYLPEDIGVISVSEADERFHSRYLAKRKTYRYRIWNSDMPCVFERKYVWNIDNQLNIPAMQDAAQVFVGTHDFLAFCSNKRFKKSSIREIYDFKVERIGPEVVFTVTGNGFLYNMVRIMVGTLVAVGTGELKKENISSILNTRVRENAGITAPPQGLCLMEVGYE